MTLLGKLMIKNAAIVDYGSLDIPTSLITERDVLSQKMRESFAPIVEAYNEGLLSAEDFYQKLALEAFQEA